MWDFGLRISKLGNRPKGASPKDNCGFKNLMLDTGYSMLDEYLPFTTDT
jgi:hypothetical protein